MLREILRDNLDELLLTVEKIAKAFEIIKGKEIESADILAIKRMIHSLKGSLQSIGMHDEAQFAIALEEEIFRKLNHGANEPIFISVEDINSWFAQLNAIEFSLKSYLF